MTRETKLGLVVAGSFLALVGGVVAVRLKQADGPPAEAEVVEAAPAETPATAPPAEEPERRDVSAAALAMADKTRMPAAPAVATPPDPKPEPTPPPAPTAPVMAPPPAPPEPKPEPKPEPTPPPPVPEVKP